MLWEEPKPGIKLNDLGWVDSRRSYDKRNNYFRCSVYLSQISSKNPKINKFSIKFKGDVKQVNNYSIYMRLADLINTDPDNCNIDFRESDNQTIKRKTIVNKNELIVEYYGGNYITNIEQIRANTNKVSSIQELKRICESFDFEFTVLSTIK